MEYSLQAIYYLLRGTVNLFLQLRTAEGVSVAGVLFAVLLIFGIFKGLGLIDWSLDDNKH